MPPSNPDPENKNNTEPVKTEKTGTSFGPQTGGASSGIDLGKILLPKKETGPSPVSAQRINAGALLAQEESAALPKPEAPTAPAAPAAPAPIAAPAPVSLPQNIPSAPTAQPQPPKPPERGIPAVQTYTSDISRVVKEGNVSSVSIAAAEAERRSKATSEETIAPQNLAAKEEASPWRWVLIIAGTLLILSAVATLAIFFIRPESSSPTARELSAPFMSVDQRTPVSQGSPATRDILMTNLEAAREQVSLSLGLVDWLIPSLAATSSESVTVPLPAQTFFSLIAPNIPEELLRSIESEYLLGVHSYDENQAFLIFRVDSYQQGYSGLLRWEETMQQELAPLFTRHPSPHIPTYEAISTASSTETQLLQTGFIDRVVENHDARVVENAARDILLLWTFLDRNTVLITTNEATLREVTRRLTTSSIVPQP